MKTKVKQPVAGQLIVFTDALGSTETDEGALSSASNRRGIPRAHRAIIQLRENLFRGQIKSLKPKHAWRIIKSVGDALVLSAEIPESPNAGKAVEACVKDLFEAWKHFNGQAVRIRIAVHYAESSHIVSGSALSARLRDHFHSLPSGLNTLNAFIASLKSDIFGPGINRSARLAHAPSGSLFVLSDNVVLKMLNRPKAFSVDELQKLYSVQTVLHPTLPLRGPIPLVKVKGVGSIGIKEPWWIWELVDDKYSDAQTFAAENKRFQVVRLVQAILPEQKTLEDRARSNSVATAPDKAFNKHLDTTLALSFFSDLVLRVEDVWTFYRPSDDRDFDDQKLPDLKWDSIRKKPSKFLPYYVVFSSSPNEATDVIVREALIDIPRAVGKANFEAISYQVQRGTRWANEQTVKEGTEPTKTLYLIFFQVRSSAVYDAANPSTLFQGKKRDFGDDGCKWNLISWGVVSGDKDGFLLVSLADGDPARAGKVLQEYLKVQCKDDKRGRQEFWERIAPIKVLVCKPRNRIGQMNLDWLNECVKRP